MVGEGFAVNAEQIRTHARNVEAIRDQFDAVKTASAAISQDDAAYGELCGWIAAVLEGRHTRQDELMAYVEENLTRAADGLRRAADNYDGSDNDNAGSLRSMEDMIGTDRMLR